MTNRSRSKSWAIYHRRWHGTHYGVYRWERAGSGGIVFRVGRLGHVQGQVFHGRQVGKAIDGRRKKHGVMVSWWGVNGRRRKKAVEVAVHR